MSYIQALDIDFLRTGVATDPHQNILGSGSTVNPYPDKVDSLIEYMLVQGYNQANLRGLFDQNIEMIPNGDFALGGATPDGWSIVNFGTGSSDLGYNNVTDKLEFTFNAGTNTPRANFVNIHPGTVNPNQYYTISVTVTATAVASGFQIALVVWNAGSTNHVIKYISAYGTSTFTISPSDWPAIPDATPTLWGGTYSPEAFMGIYIKSDPTHDDSFTIDDITLKEITFTNGATFTADAKLKIQDFVAQLTSAGIRTYAVIHPEYDELQATIENMFSSIDDYNSTRANKEQRFSGIIVEPDWNATTSYTLQRCKDAAWATWATWLPANAYQLPFHIQMGSNGFTDADVLKQFPHLVWRIGNSKEIGYTFSDSGVSAIDELGELDKDLGTTLFTVIEAGSGQCTYFPTGYELENSHNFPSYPRLREQVFKLMADTGVFGWVHTLGWTTTFGGGPQVNNNRTLSFYASAESAHNNRTSGYNTSYNKLGHFLEGRDHTVPFTSGSKPPVNRTRKDAKAIFDYIALKVNYVLADPNNAPLYADPFTSNGAFNQEANDFRAFGHYSEVYTRRLFTSIFNAVYTEGSITYEADQESDVAECALSEIAFLTNPLDAAFTALYPFTNSIPDAYQPISATLSVGIYFISGISVYSQKILRSLNTLPHGPILMDKTAYEGATGPLYSGKYSWGPIDISLPPAEVIVGTPYVVDPFNPLNGTIRVLTDGISATTSYQWQTSTSPGIASLYQYKTFSTDSSLSTSLTLTSNSAVIGGTVTYIAIRYRADNRALYPASGVTHGPLAFFAGSPGVLTIAATTTPLSGSITQTNTVSCYGDTFDLLAAGSLGTAPYTYQWYNGHPSNPGSTLIGTNAAITGLVGGTTYYVKITDNVAATYIESFQAVSPPQLQIIVSSIQSACGNSPNGSFTATAFGGTVNEETTTLRLTLTETGEVNYIDPIAPDSFIYGGLLPGTYNLTVEDALGCTASTTVTVPENSFDVVDLTQVGTLTTCPGSSVRFKVNVADVMTFDSITFSNGTPFQYDGIDSFYVDVTTPGTYYYDADVQGCVIRSVEVDLVADPPLTLNSIVVDNVICGSDPFSGALTPVVTGGCPPYSYYWSGPNGFFSTSSDITGLEVGTYQLVVTDSDGGETGDTADVIEIDIPLSVDITNSPCGSTEGTIIVTPQGGTGPFTYEFSLNGTILQSGPSNTYTAQGGDPEIVYDITVTDSGGCTGSGTGRVGLGQLTVTSTVTNVTTEGGSDGTITLTVSGGTAPYTYTWADGVNTQNRTGLPAGTYYVEIDSSDGCVYTQLYTITAPNAIADTLNLIKCCAAQKGYLAVKAESVGNPNKDCLRRMFMWITWGIEALENHANGRDCLSDEEYTSLLNTLNKLCGCLACGAAKKLTTDLAV